MSVNKWLVVFLVVYSLFVLVFFSSMNISISNGYQRAVAAGFIANLVKEDIWKLSSIADVKSLLIEEHARYKIFSGLADWPPLQLMLLAGTFVMFGINDAGLMVSSLFLTILALVFMYLLARKMYGENVALLAVILTALSTFFLQEAATPMQENGLIAFTLACIYYFVLYLEKGHVRYLYFASAAFALGFLIKTQMVLLLPSLVIVTLMEKRSLLRERKFYKSLLVALVIFFAINIPLFARETALVHVGLSTFTERSLGRLEYVSKNDVRSEGFLVAQDFEFQNELPKYKRDLIVKRFELSYVQKVLVMLTSLLFNWVLLPFIVLGFVRRKPMRAAERMLLIFVAVNVLLFTLHGLIPRLILPASIVLCLFAARGVCNLPKKFVKSAIGLVILFLLVQNYFFFVKVYHGEHIQAMQHDYDGAAKYVIENTQGDFTVITTRLYQMSFSILKFDKNRRAYVELVPEKKEDFERLLQGTVETPELAKNAAWEFPLDRPPVRFVIVHQNLETGPLKGSADYDVREFMDSYENASRVTIESSFPGAATWVYALS